MQRWGPEKAEARRALRHKVYRYRNRAIFYAYGGCVVWEDLFTGHQTPMSLSDWLGRMDMWCVKIMKGTYEAEEDRIVDCWLLEDAKKVYMQAKNQGDVFDPNVRLARLSDWRGGWSRGVTPGGQTLLMPQTVRTATDKDVKDAADFDALLRGKHVPLRPPVAKPKPRVLEDHSDDAQ